MRRSSTSLVAAIVIASGILLAPGALAARAATTQSRTDPADSAGLTAADLLVIGWDVGAGNATLSVGQRTQDATGQRVLVWVDTDADGRADLLARIERDTKTTANVSVEPVTAPLTAPCQPLVGDKAIATDAAAPVTVDGEVMTIKTTFPFDPPGGRFRWAAYGDSTTDATPYDFVPDRLAPTEGKDRFCSGGISADLSHGFGFPDGPPLAGFTTDRAEPLEGREFRAISNSSDADGTIVDWRWDTGGDDAFDDGSGAELALTLPAGDHSVALKVTDDDGLTAVVRQTITVHSTMATFPLSTFQLLFGHMWFIPYGPQPSKGTALDGGNSAPVVKVRVTPARPRAGQVVLLDASRSQDNGKVVGFEWDLNGDGETDEARGARVRTAFDHAGKVRVALEAHDDRGLGTHATVTIPVRDGRALAIRAAIRKAHRASAPGGSFERGLGGWKRVGTAFPAKPSRKGLPAAVDLRIASRLGGSYASAPSPVGAAGKGWISSRGSGPNLTGLSPDARADLPTGALVSPAFPITKRYLTLRVGGADELRGKRSLERVEVWARKGGSTRKIATVPAGSNERLREVSIDLKRVRGATGTVVVVDEGTAGHIGVDDVVLSRDLPRYHPPPPVTGFADTHTHAMVHQSFGGLLGQRTYMGVPGGDYAIYGAGAAGAAAFNADTRDFPTHFAGTPALQTAFNLAHQLVPDMISGMVHEHMHITEIHRAWEGGLRLMSSLAVSNQALEHVTGKVVDRDTGGPACVYIGGLCTDSANRVRARIPVTSDRQIIEAAVHGMRALAEANSDWMEVVYDPDQAYDVMSRGKLAVILGTEVDSLGNLGAGAPNEADWTPEYEVDWLWRRGLRQLIPVHAVDNAIGAAAEFQDVYNTTQDLINRPVRDARRDTIADSIRDQGLRMNHPGASFGAFQTVENWGCQLPTRGTVLPPGECTNWRYGDTQTLLGLDTNVLTGPLPFPATAGADRPVYGGTLGQDGQRNHNGLTPLGLRYVRQMMRRGMLIDMEHMSDHTIDALIASGTVPGEPRGPVWDARGAGVNGCESGGVFRTRVQTKDCYDKAYPLMSSHTSFRGTSMVPVQSQVRGVTTLPAVSLIKDDWAREFERTPRQIEYIRYSGGTLGPFVGHEPLLRPATVSRAQVGPPGVNVFRGEDYALRTNADRMDLNDCAGSSKSWMTNYLYALQKMGGKGVGIATDMGVVAAGSRFDPPNGDPVLPKACPSSYAYLDPQFDLLDIRNLRDAVRRERARSRDLEEAGYPWMYRRADQRNPVEYFQPGATSHPAGAIAKHTDPNGHTYDVNFDGMLTYGGLPDMLQDAVNIGVDPEDLRPLLHSAQDYVDMWRKAYRVTGCDVGARTTTAIYERCAGDGSPVDPGIGPCANTCPDSPGRGHALRPDGGRLFP